MQQGILAYNKRERSVLESWISHLYNFSGHQFISSKYESVSFFNSSFNRIKRSRMYLIESRIFKIIFRSNINFTSSLFSRDLVRHQSEPRVPYKHFIIFLSIIQYVVKNFCSIFAGNTAKIALLQRKKSVIVLEIKNTTRMLDKEIFYMF